MLRTILVPVLALLLCPPASADDWSSRILRADPSLLLEITTDDGAVRTGYPAVAGPDSVGLADAPDGPLRLSVAADDVVRVRQRRAADARGWRTGGAIGAVGAGVLGGLLAVVVSETSDENTWEDTTAPFAGAAVGFAAAGAAVGGGLGALIGSGTQAWYDLADRVPAPVRPWRLEPQAGLAAANDLGGDKYDDLHLRLFLARRFGSWCEAGPDLGWMRLGTYRESRDGQVTSVNDTWQAGATARFTLPAGGVEPFVSLGLGWYHREDSWLGTNIGLGFRIGRATAEVRTHYRSSGIDGEPSNGLLTVSAGWAFDL